MTTFEDREAAFEDRFAHDEELEFKAHARRNHKLGLWAAGLLGRTGEPAKTYAQMVVELAVLSGGDTAIAAKIQQDFAAAGVSTSTQDVERHMAELLAEARLAVRAA